MSDPTSEQERRKRLIFESMSPRMRRRIEKRGYDEWDPFLKPKEPPFVRTEREPGLPENPLELYHAYLSHLLLTGEGEEISETYRQGVMEACQIIRTMEERVRAFHDFYVWYRKAGEEKGGKPDR